ncbi:MAG: helix-turn-helix domain-containing protein [Bacteroidia bacterium]
MAARIITNLLSNAVKFTPEGGEVTLSLSRSGGASEVLEVRVADAPARASQPVGSPHIFEPIRLNEETALIGLGTGVGLALCRELAALMDGSIEVESTVGEGSTFTLRLPIHREAAPLEEVTITLAARHPFALSQSSHSLVRANEEIGEGLPLLLIIEDSPDVAQYLVACLEGRYQLLLASDGQEGIDIALEKVPDLILSDVIMPRKNGYEVCHALKSDLRTSHIPIVLLTAKTDFDSRMEGFSRGADAYLAKPFELEELLIRLDQLLGMRQKLRARYQSYEPQEPASDETIHAEDAFIRKLQHILDEHLLDTDFGITGFCNELGMSRSQLYQKVKALTGRSTSIYIRFLRLNKARKLLQNSQLNVAEVAYQVGFSDPKYFSRTYQQEFGEPPSQTKS